MADIEKKQDEKVEKKSKVKKDKPSLGSRIASWFRGFKAEFKKIVWVTPRNVVINTAIVLVVVLVVGVVLFMLDFLFSNAFIGLHDIIG